MSLVVQLLGRPRATRAGAEAYRFRSRKSWALLAYLLLTERAPTRAQLAGMLFAEADDPLRTLRWSLAEIRRALGADGSVDGDPVVLHLDATVVVDVAVLAHGSWVEAVGLPGLGAELLDGVTLQGAAAFESWLLSEQRRVAASAEAVLHEAALGWLSRGVLDTAREYAVRAAAMSPLDENSQALLIRLYRLAGDDEAAERQFAAWSKVAESELGVGPGVAAIAALQEVARRPEQVADAASTAAVVEAGSAAVSAGAVDAGAQSLRTAVRLADAAGLDGLRVRARLVLAEALVHALGGLDEEGLATLYEADAVARASGDADASAQARAELGYVDFLRARYDRAEVWLTDAQAIGAGSLALAAKTTTYLGSVESDRGSYLRATDLLHDAVRLSREAGDPRREAFALSMLGRLELLCGRADAAARHLDASLSLAEQDRWLAFLPWPQALRGEADLVRGDLTSAAELLRQAFARACQIGDPCWEATAARGLALLAEASGDTGRAFEVLIDARVRGRRLADPYVWLDVHILDALCELGLRHEHPGTRRWVDTMRELASRTGMKELVVRSRLHGAALGDAGDAEAAALLAQEVDNPALDLRVRALV